MAYQALYRKYRPTVFSDVVGQEHITQTLKQEIIDGKLSHAYLFTGTRGTGKTTCAKILARAVNCLSHKDGNPCGECEMCRAVSEGEITDIVEIDAASNNNVDNIRELRDQIAFPPAAAKYRVYIIDEVHMLSPSAFNALLKTLEEPPSYVIFILATTEVHKLPATILSRCQRFDFRRIEPSSICERIMAVAAAEGFTVTDEAAQLIASLSDGGMRDALSALDLCASGNNMIDEDVVAKACAMAGNEYLLKLAEFIKSGDTEKALLLIDELHNSSVDMVRLLSELTNHYRNLMIVKTVKTKQKPIVCSASQLAALEKQAESYDIREIMDVLSVLQDTAPKMATGNRRAQMEMTVIRLTSPQVFTDITALERRITALEQGTVKTVPQNINSVASEVKTEVFKEKTTTVKDNEPEINEDVADDDEIPLPEAPVDDDYASDLEVSPQKPQSEPPKANTPDGVTFVAEWDKIVARLRTTCPLIAGVLMGSAAYIKGDYLLIDSKNGQFKTLVNGANSLYRDQIRKAALEVLGKTYKLGPYNKPQENETDVLAAFAQKLKNLEK
ncbi:MAG: DNA polymerase III subunit gamma/tau [Ruminococcaceae bacterium]|nr:DNA polymerase III subunit gamma/tau [Oscillospiraceae bacterium]